MENFWNNVSFIIWLVSADSVTTEQFYIIVISKIILWWYINNNNNINLLKCVWYLIDTLLAYTLLWLEKKYLFLNLSSCVCVVCFVLFTDVYVYKMKSVLLWQFEMKGNNSYDLISVLFHLTFIVFNAFLLYQSLYSDYCFIYVKIIYK